MTIIRRETVADKSATELRQRIIQGELRPGEPITEEAIADELGVSRATVRQALNTLLFEGLLTRHHATRVLQVTTLSVEDVRDIYRARRFLELGGVDAAAHASAEQLAPIITAVDDIQATVFNHDVVGFVEADYRWHAAVVGLLESVHLSAAHAHLMAKLRLAITASEHDSTADLAGHLEVHKKFAQLLAAGAIEEARANLLARLTEAEEAVIDQVARLAK